MNIWQRNVDLRKKKRKYNPNKIKSNWSYTLQEIARVYSVHPRTAQSWHKSGLKTIDENTRPYLFYGVEIRRYLNSKRVKNKFKLKNDEFNCNKCRIPRKSIVDKIEMSRTGRRLGKYYYQVIIKGICEVCGTRLIRFSSDRQVEDLKMKITEHNKGLNENVHCYLNTDLERNGELAKTEH